MSLLAILSGFSAAAIAASWSAVPLPAIGAVGLLVGLSVSARLRGIGPVLPEGAGQVLTATRHWPWMLCFLALPVWAFSTAPGADAAMYAGIARAMLDGSNELSAAWPGISVTMYPRGFSALIALFAPLVGMAKASLVAAMLSYLVYAVALRTWVGVFAPARTAWALATALLLVSRHVPLSFLSWGGNPTALGFALGLCAIVLGAHAEHPRVRACAPLLLGGAFASHPIGAFAGVACAPLVLFVHPFDLMRLRRLALTVIVIAPLLWCFKSFGPEVSAYETDWIRAWQAGQAKLIRNTLDIFVLDYLSTVSAQCSDLFAVIAYTCIGVVAWRWRQYRRAALLAFFGLIYVAIVMVVGPRLPVVGTFIYADRMTPIWIVAFAPVITAVTSHAASLPLLERFPPRRLAAASAIVLLLLSYVAHRGQYFGEPLAQRDDVALADCVRRQVPEGEPIYAAYGQGGQWLPALVGRVITDPHVHCSLYDEMSAIRRRMRSRFQYLGPPPVYREPLPLQESEETLCAQGEVKLVRLRHEVEAGPDPW